MSNSSPRAIWVGVLVLVFGCYCPVGPTTAYAQNDCISPDIAHTLGEEQILHEVVAARAVDQTVFVLTQSDPVLHRFELQSGSYTAWGAKGEGPGEVQNPQGLAVDDDAVYVLDTQPGANRRLSP